MPAVFGAAPAMRAWGSWAVLITNDGIVQIDLGRELRDKAGRAAPEPFVSVARDEAVERITEDAWHETRRSNQVLHSSRLCQKMNGRVRLRKASTTIEYEESQRVIRIEAVISQ
jgi:hypothetical protein